VDAAGWDARYRATDLVWTANPNQFLVAEVAELSPGTVLDLGAGERRNAVWLAQRGSQVTAVDFSAVGFAKAAQLGDAAGVTLTAVCADVADYTTNLSSGHGGPHDPDVLFSPDDVVAELANAGVVIDRADRVHRSVETAGGERTAIDALVRAHRPGGR